MRRFIPTGLRAVLKALQPLPRPVQEHVLRAHNGELAREGTVAICRSLIPAELRQRIRVPKDLADPERIDGFQEQVWTTAGKSDGGHTLADEWPGADAELRRARKRASEKLPAALAAYANAKAQADDLVQERELYLTGPDVENLPQLRAKRTKLGIVLVALWVMEALSALAAVALAKGMLDYPSLGQVPNSLWVQALVIGVPLAFGSFGIAWYLGRRIRRTGVSALAERRAFTVAIGAAVALVAGVVLYRVIGLLPANEVGSSLRLADAISGAVLGPTLSLVISTIAAESIGHTVAELDARVECADQAESNFRSRQARYKEEVAATAATVRSHRLAIRRPAYYAGCFEREVARARELHLDAKARTDHFVFQTLDVWAEIQRLPPSSRQFLKAHWDELLAEIAPPVIQSAPATRADRLTDFADDDFDDDESDDESSGPKGRS